MLSFLLTFFEVSLHSQYIGATFWCVVSGRSIAITVEAPSVENCDSVRRLDRGGVDDDDGGGVGNGE